MFSSDWLTYKEKEGADKRLEPLTPCSLRVIGPALQGCARACKYRISRRPPLLGVVTYCTVLRSRWYQSGINSGNNCFTIVLGCGIHPKDIRHPAS